MTEELSITTWILTGSCRLEVAPEEVDSLFDIGPLTFNCHLRIQLARKQHAFDTIGRMEPRRLKQ